MQTLSAMKKEEEMSSTVSRKASYLPNFCKAAWTASINHQRTHMLLCAEVESCRAVGKVNDNFEFFKDCAPPMHMAKTLGKLSQTSPWMKVERACNKFTY